MFPTIIAIRNERVVAAVSTPRMLATLSCAERMAIGLSPVALVVAAQGKVEGYDAIAYHVMTTQRQGVTALQQVQVKDGELFFGTPFKPEHQGEEEMMQTLAQALAQEPLAVDKVSRRDPGGTFGQDLYLPPEQGRVVIDAGTMRTLHERVRGIAGQALYIARSPEAGRLALDAGLPRPCLLGGPEAAPSGSEHA